MDTINCKVLYQVGDNLDTDIITPGKYLTAYNDAYLASICMKDVYPDFLERMKKGGAIISGRNFGCGSSRETAPIALKASGTKVIIAKSFARIFYRNAFNIGLPCIICRDVGSVVKLGDDLCINYASGYIKNLTTGVEIAFDSIPENLLNILVCGGLMESLKQKFCI